MRMLYIWIKSILSGTYTWVGLLSGTFTLEGGAIKFEGEMLDPPMFGKALQTLLRAYALNALKDDDIGFTLEVLNKLPQQVIRQNWPYGEIE